MNILDRITLLKAGYTKEEIEKMKEEENQPQPEEPTDEPEPSDEEPTDEPEPSKDDEPDEDSKDEIKDLKQQIAELTAALNKSYVSNSRKENEIEELDEDEALNDLVREFM